MSLLRRGRSLVEAVVEAIVVDWSLCTGDDGYWFECDVMRPVVGPQGQQENVLFTCYADKDAFEFMTVEAVGLSPEDVCEVLTKARSIARQQLPLRVSW